MTYPETQINAFHSLERLPEKRRKVAEAIKTCPGTLAELSFRLGWAINRVSGRVSELAKMGIVRDSGHRRINPDSGKPGIVWAVR